jgi:hypothetical protein
MTVWLTQQGFAVNRKRVQRLMRLMDIEAVYGTMINRPRDRRRLGNNENPSSVE